MCLFLEILNFLIRIEMCFFILFYIRLKYVFQIVNEWMYKLTGFSQSNELLLHID